MYVISMYSGRYWSCYVSGICKVTGNGVEVTKKFKDALKFDTFDAALDFINSHSVLSYFDCLPSYRGVK